MRPRARRGPTARLGLVCAGSGPEGLRHLPEDDRYPKAASGSAQPELLSVQMGRVAHTARRARLRNRPEPERGRLSSLGHGFGWPNRAILYRVEFFKGRPADLLGSAGWKWKPLARVDRQHRRHHRQWPLAGHGRIAQMTEWFPSRFDLCFQPARKPDIINGV